MKNFKQTLIDYLYILVGSFVLAFAVSFFLVPCMISTGGVSGVATVLYHLFGIPLSITTFVINLALFFLGYKTLKGASLIKTLFGIVFFSVSLSITDLIAATFTDAVAAVTADIWMAAIFGGVLVGVGVGLVVLKEASTGGSDFAALAFNKLIPHISVASFIMIIDTTVILVSAIALPTQDIGQSNLSIMLYSVVSLYISTKVTDLIIIRGAVARSVYIVSDKSEQIARDIMDKLERGVTAIHSMGCYSGKERNMLMCIVRTSEVPRVLSIVKEHDKNAFTVISEAKEVRGLGFIEDGDYTAEPTAVTDKEETNNK